MAVRRPSVSISIALALLAIGAPGCAKKSPPTPNESGPLRAPSALPSALGSASPPAASPSFARPELVSSASAWKSSPCRAMRVTGSVRTDSGSVLATQSGLDGREWLELGKQSELVVRHGASARELSLHGPGRFLPCRSGLEQVLIASGTLHSSPGTGVRPGAEVWVATPFGALRYADANIELAVERSSLRVLLRGGLAFTEAAEGLRGVQNGQLAGPDGRASARGKPDASALVLACERAARAAESSARQVLAAKPGELGQLAAIQLRSRRLARARCLVAEASVGQLEDADSKSRLGDQIKKLEVLWQGIPTPAGEAQAPRR